MERGKKKIEFCFHSKTVLIVFKNDRIVVGMVFFWGQGLSEHAITL